MLRGRIAFKVSGNCSRLSEHRKINASEFLQAGLHIVVEWWRIGEINKNNNDTAIKIL